ncbi:MAG TPA: hemerythrin domain-containing protein [Burkholderiales bacterium]
MSGATAAGPLDELQAGHGRIEEQLQALERLAHRASASAEESVAAQAVLSFFETFGAQHHRDEDEDLLPLLRVRAAALGRIEVAAAIDEIEREHATLETQWRRLREPLSAIAARRHARLDAGEAGRFAWLYRRHMDRETQLVLPFAREALGTKERAELGARMAKRRSAK